MSLCGKQQSADHRAAPARVLLAPSPSIAIGTMPIIIASAVMITDVCARAASIAARGGPYPQSSALLRRNHQMLLAVATPMHMMAPVSEGTFSVVCVIKSSSRCPPRSDACMMMKGSSQDENSHDQQVSQHIAPISPTPNPKTRIHRLYLARITMWLRAANLFGLLHQPPHFCATLPNLSDKQTRTH